VTSSDDQVQHAQIVACLLAAGVAARVLHNTAGPIIEVRLVDGTRALWGKSGGSWGYTLVVGTGEVEAHPHLAADGSPEALTAVIMGVDYPVTLEPHLEQ